MQNLFRSPSPALSADLEATVAAIIAAMPISTAHGKELPYAVRDLSRLLTQERSRLASSYWINKRLLTAYCRYFLPWNLVRLAWMLPSLGLTLRPGDTVLDLGSGPLTLPLALWTALPHLRTVPLTVICGDVAPSPLAAGRDIFRRLAPSSPWKIELRRGPMHALLRSFSGKAALISACNVLNEARTSRETSLENRLGELAAAMAPRLAPQGRILVVEPGTRLGGKLTALFRHAAFTAHLVPEGPCTHWGACPMLAERATGWCHFSHTVRDIPAPLADLTRKAKLEKQSLNLSCMLLRAAAKEETAAARNALPEIPLDDDEGWEEDWDDDADTGLDAPAPDQTLRDAWAAAYGKTHPAAHDHGFVRIISDPIRLPDSPDPARYGCCAKGLALVGNALRIPSGAALEAHWPPHEQRDLKTGALMLTLPPQASTPKPTPKAERDRAGQPGSKPAPKSIRDTAQRPKRTPATKSEPGQKPARKPISKPAPKPKSEPAHKPARKPAKRTAPRPSSPKCPGGTHEA